MKKRFSIIGRVCFNDPGDEAETAAAPGGDDAPTSAPEAEATPAAEPAAEPAAAAD